MFVLLLTLFGLLAGARSGSPGASVHAEWLTLMLSGPLALRAETAERSILVCGLRPSVWANAPPTPPPNA